MNFLRKNIPLFVSGLNSDIWSTVYDLFVCPMQYTFLCEIPYEPFKTVSAAYRKPGWSEPNRWMFIIVIHVQTPRVKCWDLHAPLSSRIVIILCFTNCNIFRLRTSSNLQYIISFGFLICFTLWASACVECAFDSRRNRSVARQGFFC